MKAGGTPAPARARSVQCTAGGSVFLFAIVAAGATATASRDAFASGFALKEQSVTAQGNAFAGATAGAEDASYLFFNPAAMTRIEGSQAVNAATFVRPVARFDAKDASTAAGTPIQGGNGGGNGAESAVLPALYAVVDLSETVRFVDDLHIGLGINAPFGLETDYENGWIGRYHALQSKLKTVNVNPAIAFKVLERLSVGFGLQAQYATAELSNAIDFGSIAAVIPALQPIAQPTQQDGRGRIEGDAWAFGYTAGLLYEPWQGTRFGVGYRSAIKHNLKGDARFRLDPTVGPAIAAGSGAFAPTGARAKLNLPEMVSLGAHHDIDEQWSVMGEAAWTRWSRFDELRIRFGNPAQPDSVTDEEWHDTWFFAAGATYRPTKSWAIRLGTAYDQSPVPNSKRTPRIPDNDRVWLSFGGTYQPTATVAVTLGYAHLFMLDSSIKLSANDPGNRARGNLSGDYESHIDLFGAQIQIAF
ncbi:MAG: outer membrane protein transport protein [Rhodospirillales bacterium]|nr:outer membrane protein transport protein [Rhodospirillales bacterium]